MATRRKKEIPPYKVINWDINHDDIEYYDVMPYLVSCWDTEKKRKHKIWNMTFNEEADKGKDDTKMPETFDEFKKFILEEARYNFWARCEYECIVTGWPTQKNEVKIDVFEQIKANIDVLTKHFMNYIKGFELQYIFFTC